MQEIKLENSSSNTQTKWSSNKSDNNFEKDIYSLQNFGQGPIGWKMNGLNLSQQQKNTFSQSTMKSFKSKQSLQQKIKGSMKMIKENKFLKTEKLYEKKMVLNAVPYSLSLMKNLINNDTGVKGKIHKKYKASSIFKMSRKKSSEFRKSKNEVIWKDNEPSDKLFKQSKLEINLKHRNNPLNKIPHKKKTFKKKKNRFSLNESRNRLRKSKHIRENLLKQLMLVKDTNQFPLPQKNNYLNIQSEILGKTADSVILNKQTRKNKSIKIKKSSLKLTIKGKLKDIKQDLPKVESISEVNINRF